MEISNSNIEKYIENNVEKKINQILDILPTSNHRIEGSKLIFEYTLGEIYTNLIECTVDIINDVSTLVSERKYLNTMDYIRHIYRILLKPERRLYIGILLVILSFILYFIDGSTI
jgi:hypothetical protein